MTITPDPERLAALDDITLDRGSHGNFEQGACAMEVVSWLAGEGEARGDGGGVMSATGLAYFVFSLLMLAVEVVLFATTGSPLALGGMVVCAGCCVVSLVIGARS